VVPIARRARNVSSIRIRAPECGGQGDPCATTRNLGVDPTRAADLASTATRRQYPRRRRFERNPLASVIVCTHNRAAQLGRCLDSLASGVEDDEIQELLEIVLVDNASTDTTEDLLDRMSSHAPWLRYEHEPRLGLSHARNRGIEVAKGEILAFVDDDAIADPGWLRGIVDCYSRWPVSAVGGRVALDWPDGRPRWLVPKLEPLFSGYDLGDVSRIMEANELPFGANMSVHREVAIEAGGFDPDLGRSGPRSLLSNEEVEFFMRVRRRGASIAYAPKARVTHLMTPERASRLWLLRRAYAQGRSNARLDARVGDDGESAEWLPFDNRPRRALARATVLGWRWFGQRLRSSENRQGEVLYEASRRCSDLGFVLERLHPTASAGTDVQTVRST
jgi:glycosyltransferase involved in cell wall biosynthesis